MATRDFDFDFFVIGGGSAGVRGARMAAAQYGVRVGLAECAELGGTCVNVGCIPKKLYSYAAGYADAYDEAAGFGWDFGFADRVGGASRRLPQRARHSGRGTAQRR